MSLLLDMTEILLSMYVEQSSPLVYVIMYKWMDDMRFYVLFNSIWVILGRWDGGNKRVCGMEFRL